MKIRLVLFVVFIVYVSAGTFISEAKTKEPVKPHEQRLLPVIQNNYRSGKYGPLLGLVVQKGDSILFEEALSFDEPYFLESITKSITSLVVGIAIARGDLQGVDQPISDFFPEYKRCMKKGWEKASIGDLLSMHSGIQWEEDKRPEFLNPTFQMYHTKDLYEYILTRELDTLRAFNYSSANAALLSGILTKATGVTVEQYVFDHLFKPLGITQYIWTNYKNGATNTSGGLLLMPHDLLKIGRLCLQKGRWKDKQIISEKWFDELFKARTELNEYRDVKAYGYLWWLSEYSPAPGAKALKIYSACGFNNNHLLLIPEKDLVIVMLGNGADCSASYLNVLRDVLK